MKRWMWAALGVVALAAWLGRPHAGSPNLGHSAITAGTATSATTASRTSASRTASATRAAGAASTLAGDGVDRVQGRKSTMPTDEFLVRSFEATGTTADGYLVHSWSQISQTYTSAQNLSKIAGTLEKDLGIRNAKVLSKTEDGEVYYEAQGSDALGNQVSVTLTSFHFTNAPSSTILVVKSCRNLPDTVGGTQSDSAGAQSNPAGTQSDSAGTENEPSAKPGISAQNTPSTRTDSMMEQFTQSYDTLVKAVSSLQGTPQISACIEGFASARMSDGQKGQLITEACNAVQARRIEGLASSLVTSISAWSPLASAHILTHGEPMNLQVAIHYDAYHHRTNVLVGSPIITIAY